MCNFAHLPLARARVELALSELFAKSGWTQQQLAEKESEITGKKVSRPYIAQRLKFGSFLQFVATGNNSEKQGFEVPIDLSERKFREYWSKTDKGTDERLRFRRVAAMIKEDSEVIDSFCRFKRDETAIPSGKVATAHQARHGSPWRLFHVSTPAARGRIIGAAYRARNMLLPNFNGLAISLHQLCQ